MKLLLCILQIIIGIFFYTSTSIPELGAFIGSLLWFMAAFTLFLFICDMHTKYTAKKENKVNKEQYKDA